MKVNQQGIRFIDQLLFADQNSDALLALDQALTHRTDSDSTGLIELIARRIEALMGLGRLDEALVTIDQYASLTKQCLVVLTRSRFELAWANVLFTANRVSEALVHYELALIPLKRSHGTLFYDGRIWRELALAYFGDLRALEHLRELRNQMILHRNEYLTALATCFLVEAAHRFGITLSKEEQESCQIIRFPGLRNQALAVLNLLPKKQLLSELSAQTQGIKGYPWVLSLTFVNASENEFWIRHIEPIVSLRNQSVALLFPDLPDTPFLRSTACQNCDGRCCYDGVYITATEEAAIDAFRKQYPKYFDTIPKEYLEIGEWGFVFNGKRTKRKEHLYSRLDYPKHFQRVKCVLALPNGECSLQRAASDELFHPWKYKPEICWEFPLIGLFNDDALTHPHYFGQTDPAYIDESRPGYLSFLPCSQVFKEGVSWKSVYQNELQYFFYMKKNK